MVAPLLRYNERHRRADQALLVSPALRARYAMAAKGEARVLYCGFKKIENVDAYFKTSCLVRGRHLYDSNHVYAVREEIVASAAPSEVIGKCAAQMKTAEYEVRLQVNLIFVYSCYFY